MLISSVNGFSTSDFISTVSLSDRVRVVGNLKEVRQKLGALPLDRGWVVEIGKVGVSELADDEGIMYSLRLENITRCDDSTIIGRATLIKGIVNHGGYLQYLAAHGQHLSGLNILNNGTAEIDYQGFDMSVNAGGEIVLALKPDKLIAAQHVWESELVERIGWAARYYLLSAEPGKYKYHSFDNSFSLIKEIES